MRRRVFLGGMVRGLAAPLAAGAQQAEKVHRVGFLGNPTAALEATLVGPLRDGLRDLGHVEGWNIVIEGGPAAPQWPRARAATAGEGRPGPLR